MKKPYIIGITGLSASGKSYAVRKLEEKFRDQIVFISQDNYYKDESKIGLERWERAKYDNPQAFDNAMLADDVEKLIQGKSIKSPKYDFATRHRMGKIIKLKPSPIIIIEGLFIFNLPILRNLMGMKVFLYSDPDVRLARKLIRDIEERGATVKNLKASIKQYLDVVKPMQEAFILPEKRYANLVINTNEGGKVAVRILERYINDKLEKYSRA